jgi:hypothetical protein
MSTALAASASFLMLAMMAELPDEVVVNQRRSALVAVAANRSTAGTLCGPRRSPDVTGSGISSRAGLSWDDAGARQ